MKLDFSQNRCGEYTRYNAELTDVSQELREMYLEIPSALEQHVGERYSNALLLLSLFECMKIGGEIHINMPVERQLADNMEEFARVWSVWCPESYSPIVIKGETYACETIQKAAGSQALQTDIAGYSGGVDASYVVAHSLTPGLKPEVHLGACVLIHGADIPLEDKEVFERVFRQSEENLEKFGIPLYPVRTNVRVHKPDWEEIFYCVLAAVLRLFSKTYRRGIISTDENADVNTHKFPWGGNPITDPMFSTPEFGNVTLGLTVGRTARCQLVSTYPDLMKKLRVCWQSNANGGNCGVCEKCIRTKLNLMACGVTGDVPFRVPFAIEQVYSLQPAKDKCHTAFYRDIYEYDSAHGKVLPSEVREAILGHIKRSTAFCLHEECVRVGHELPPVERILVVFTRKGLTLLAKLRKLFHVR